MHCANDMDVQDEVIDVWHNNRFTSRSPRAPQKDISDISSKEIIKNDRKTISLQELADLLIIMNFIFSVIAADNAE